MTAAQPPARERRRLVVALGGGRLAEDMLEAMGELAAAMEAELAGLFVEDINLLRLAGLPFARVFSHEWAGERRFETGALEEELRAQARAAERALAAVAARAGVPYSFRVTRGLLESALLEAAQEADLLALGAVRRVLLSTQEVRIVGRETTEIWQRRAGRPSPHPEIGPVAVVFNRTSAAPRVLEAAAGLARRNGRPLLVFLVASSEENAAKLKARAVQSIPSEQPVQFRTLIAPGLPALIQAVRAAEPCGLVLDAGRELLSRETIQALQEALTCQMLLVR